MAGSIPEVVIFRLPLYLRALSRLVEEGRQVANSWELGERLGMTPAQIRKDLSYFGRFGKQGKGYDVRRLLWELRRILGLDRQWSMVLIGVGRLGRAILSYAGFAPHGFNIVAAFDIDPGQIGKRVGPHTVKGMDELEAAICRLGINIGIVAVPPSHLQEAVDALVRCGIRAILSYAPVAARVPKGVLFRDIDPALALQSLTYHLKS